MPNYNLDQLFEVMNNPQNIRNMSVIAHVDHGKTTLTDSLIAYAGIIANDKVGQARETDYDEEEKERGITIKSTGVSLFYELQDFSSQGSNNAKIPSLINLIDCPGHVDFSSEVTAALRVTDGALVVVDFVEGVCVQTETVLRQALTEKIKPVLMINKIDRGIMELQVDGETMYQKFLRVIESANVTISTYDQGDMPEQQAVDPTLGTVAFGSALFGWAFTLQKFSRMYAAKFNVPQELLMKKLWGDNYYDASQKQWITTNIGSDGKILQRGFVEFIMDPIISLVRKIMEDKKEAVFKITQKLNIPMTSEEQQLVKKDLLRNVFMKWLNAAESLLEMIVAKLPSPAQAQRYRTPFLYEGPVDDACSQAMMNCDPNGPLMIYISKMVKTAEKGRFYAFGRVFSGTAKTGAQVRIMGPFYKQGSKEDLYIKNIQRIVLMMGSKVEAVSEVPCGNTLGLVGIDKYLMKSGTISDCEEAYTIKAMKYSVSPVVRVAVETKNAVDLPKLIEGLRTLVKVDPLVQCYEESSGEHIVAGCGDLHIEICIKELERIVGIPISVSEPVVSYRETVTEQSYQTCLSKSANKHNRIWAEAEPLDEELCKAIENKDFDVKLRSATEIKNFTQIMHDKYDWDRDEAKKIWCFGPDEVGSNLLVDQTQGNQYLSQVKDSIVAGFQWVTKEGILCQEEMRGIRFNIKDAQVHSSRQQCGGAQIIPTARRVCYASQMTAKPRLQEPYFLCAIQSENSVVNSIYRTLNQRRGQVIGEEPVEGTPLVMIKAYLPVAESFGFTQLLRSETSGRAFPQCVFDHWQTINADPFEEGSKAAVLVEQIRKRKGLQANIPALENFLDKL